MSLVSINDVLKITTKVEKIHPYKVVEDRGSYSSYNEGWSDCISLIESYLEKLPTAEPERKWIPVSEALPEEGESVIVCSQYGAICIVELVKGISQETRRKMENGEIDNPDVKLWCLSDGYTTSKRSSTFREGDEWGNNEKDYVWRNGPYHYSGQEFIAWMPLPEPYKE